MKILFLQIPHDEMGSGGKVITERNKYLLGECFGRENIISPVELRTWNFYFDLSYEKKIENAIIQNEIDVVFLDTSILGLFSRAFYKKNIVIVFCHNVECLYSKHVKITSVRTFLERQFVRLSEKRNLSLGFRIITLNRRDSEELFNIYGRRADYVLSTSMEDKFIEEQSCTENKKNYLLFVGSDFYGNTDGLFAFIEEAMPHIEAELIVVGMGMEKYAGRFSHKYKTTFIGFTKDLGEMYRYAYCVVLPIITGSGMKTKTCEALMYGKKIFGTPEAFEGYDFLDPDACVLCNNNREFIEKINNYLNEGTELFSETNRRTFLQHYSNHARSSDFCSFLKASFKLLSPSIQEKNTETDFKPLRVGKTDRKIKVSVIMPVYNTREYFKEAVESVLHQTLAELELIIVDDGSTDGCLNMALDYAALDDRVSVYTENNSGQGTARNNAVKIAKGEYLYFLDSDDSIESIAFEELYEKASLNKLDFVFFAGRNISRIQNSYDEIYTGRELFVRLKQNNECAFSPCLIFVNRDFYRNNKIEFLEGVFIEDMVPLFKIYTYAKRVGVINKQYFNRRIRMGSTTESRPSVKHVIGCIKYYDCLLKELETDGLSELEKRIINTDSKWILYEIQKMIKRFYAAERSSLKKYITENIDEMNRIEDVEIFFDKPSCISFAVERTTNIIHTYGLKNSIQRLTDKLKGYLNEKTKRTFNG